MNGSLSRFLLPFIASLIALPLPLRSQGASAAVPPASTSTTPLPHLLRDDSLLQQKITLEETDRPLDQVLSALSPKLPVDLIASSRVADQRVTLRLTDQPVYVLMERLPALLSHSAASPHGYHWSPVDRDKGHRPAYRLWRDIASLSEEQAALDYPHRELAVMLRDLRNLARLPVKERANYKGDYPYATFSDDAPNDPFRQAFQGLTDDQIQALVDGQTLPLDPAPFAVQIAAFRQNQLQDTLNFQKTQIAAGMPDPYPNGVPSPPEIPPSLSVSLGYRDRQGSDTVQDSLFQIHLDGVAGGALGVDVYDTTKSPDPDRSNPIPSGTGPVIDLTAALKGKGVTDAQRGDVGFTLQALAKAAGIDVFQEAFLRPSARWSQQGLTTLKGTLPVLIAAVCTTWNYHSEKVGDDYLFWSRTWAPDRAADIPDRLVVRWKTRLQKQNGVTLDDRAEMAAALTWPQVKLTLSVALPEAGGWGSLTEYNILRLIGRIQPTEREAAFSPAGLALADMTPWEQEELVTDFQNSISDATNDQLGHSVLRFVTENDGPPGLPPTIERVIMKLGSENRLLFEARAFVDLALPSASSSP